MQLYYNGSKGLSNMRASQYYIVASRGRNPENPSDRTKGIHLEQRLEVNWHGYSNTITSVQKDNWVLEIYGNNKDKASN